jgi:hypothetical protein
MALRELSEVASVKPVKVTWHDADNQARYKGFDLIPNAQRFAKRLRESGLSAMVWVQGELFEPDETGNAKAYDPRYEIPY